MLIQRKLEYQNDPEWKVFCGNIGMYLDGTFHIRSKLGGNFLLERSPYSFWDTEDKFITLHQSTDVEVRMKEKYRDSTTWVNFVYNHGVAADSVLSGQLYSDNTLVILQKEFLMDAFDIVIPTPLVSPIHKIFKYQIPIKERTHVDLPAGAQILRVDGLEGALWLWALCNTETKAIERREFALFKTGGNMPEDILTGYRYVGYGAIFIQQELMMYIFEKVNSHG